MQFFDMKRRLHDSLAGSNTDRSRNNRSRRAWRRGGASSAATKASHPLASSVKIRRSASRSSASLSAVSSTNSLTDLRSAAAAACRVFLAARLNRRSSFSVRLVRWVIFLPQVADGYHNLPDNVTTNRAIARGPVNPMNQLVPFHRDDDGLF